MTKVWSAPTNPQSCVECLARCLRLEASALLDWHARPSERTAARLRAAHANRLAAEQRAGWAIFDSEAA